MIRNHVARFAGLRRRALVVVAAALAPLAFASPASATIHHPKGNFAPFADCPLSNAAVEGCTIAQTTSGEFTVGKKTVPINKTITLQGGLIGNEKTGEAEFVAAENGETLSKTALNVPGGLLGIEAPKSWPILLQYLFNELVINDGLTGVTETTELAKPASAIRLNPTDLLEETGVALQLPTKIKLSNVFLGNECYVGSSSSPITLNLTTGTTSPPEPNKPIKGAAGALEVLESGTLIRLTGGALVDNSFSAPEATGCGGIFSGLIDPLVDSILGLPSASGHNTAILKGKFEEASAAAVKASE